MTAGALLLLEDGRYAVTGPVLAVGGREDLTAWIKRRLRRSSDDERAWLQGVIGTLGAEGY